MFMNVDLHVHTKYSFDSFLEPKDAIKFALRQGLTAIAITDHDTTKGGFAALNETSKARNLTIIPGIEIKTDRGDIIGLFVLDEIKTREFFDVIDEIKDQGGLVILPHPYKSHKNIKEIAEFVDVIEVFNGRCSTTQNLKAFKLSKDLGKPAVASSDAHFSFEIGRFKTRLHTEIDSSDELKKIILNCNRDFIGKELPFIVHGFSFAIEVAKRFSHLIFG